MTEVCRTHGVRLLAYGTLAGGFLSERWLGRAEPLIDDVAGLVADEVQAVSSTRAGGWERFQALLRVVDGVARRTRTAGDSATRRPAMKADPNVTSGLDGPPTGVSIANVACRYVLEHPAVAGIIVGARLGEIRATLATTSMSFSFSAGRRRRARELDAACAELDPIGGDCGDEYRRPPYLTASGDLSDHLTHAPRHPTRSRAAAALAIACLHRHALGSAGGVQPRGAKGRPHHTSRAPRLRMATA